jgi:phenylacetate-CoA ligase
MADNAMALRGRANLPKRHRATYRGRLYARLQELRGRPFGRYMRILQDWEKLSPEDYRRTHEGLLREALEFAYRHAPFYKTGEWDRSLSNGKHGEIGNWPLLGKERLIANFEELLARPQPASIVSLYTSGTSGSPTKILTTPDAEAWGWASRHRALLWHGIPVGVSTLRVSHHVRTLRDFVKGEKSVRSLGSPKAIDEAARYLTEKRPTLVSGLPSSLFYLARCLRERGVTTPPALFARVGGAQLFEFQRTEIESCLGGRAIDSYGSTETGALAGECPAGSRHVHAAHVHVEIFRGDVPAEPGEHGEIVVTSLRNTAMPLVRYRVGDRGRLSPDPCECGLPLPVLADVQARPQESIPAADGSPCNESALLDRLESFFADPVAGQVRHVRFSQVDQLNWKVWLDVSEGFMAQNDQSQRTAIDNRIGDTVRQAFGERCKVTTEFATGGPREGEKIRYVAGLIDRSTRSAAQAPP